MARKHRILRMVYHLLNGGNAQFSHLKLNVGLNDNNSMAQERTHRLRRGVWSQRAGYDQHTRHLANCPALARKDFSLSESWPQDTHTHPRGFERHVR